MRENAQGPNVLDARKVDFEYEGEMTVDVALNVKAHGALSVPAVDGPRECAGRARTALCLDFRQADARNGGRHRYRPHSVRRRKTCANLLAPSRR